MKTYSEYVSFKEENLLDEKNLWNLLKGGIAGLGNTGSQVVRGAANIGRGATNLGAGGIRSGYGLAKGAVTGDWQTAQAGARQMGRGVVQAGAGATQALAAPVSGVIRAGQAGRQDGMGKMAGGKTSQFFGLKRPETEAEHIHAYWSAKFDKLMHERDAIKQETAAGQLDSKTLQKRCFTLNVELDRYRTRHQLQGKEGDDIQGRVDKLVGDAKKDMLDFYKTEFVNLQQKEDEAAAAAKPKPTVPPPPPVPAKKDRNADPVATMKELNQSVHSLVSKFDSGRLSLDSTHYELLRVVNRYRAIRPRLPDEEIPKADKNIETIERLVAKLKKQIEAEEAKAGFNDPDDDDFLLTPLTDKD